ncbi:MAG TPA: alpha/beta hydrolase [Cyclobacteriaceae bacterium]|nr:alpha/beta hydrolase [Cyclobacteriaceae bacterium]
MKRSTPLIAAIVTQFLLCTPSFSQQDRYVLSVSPMQFKAAGGEADAELCSFSVPEKRPNKHSRLISLSFVRFKCTGQNCGSPIVYLAGGPGGSGIAAAKGPRFELFMALREFGDVVALDQRGTGLSNHLEACEPPYRISIEQPGSREELVGTVRKNLIHCMNFWKEKGIDVTGYNNLESAEDLEDLRKVLGAKKISLWGISYGTQLAFSFLKTHGASVDKLILASLEATGDNIKQPLYADHLLERIEKEVLRDPVTAAAFPDLRGSMRRVLERLEGNPIAVSTEDQKGNEFKVGISKFDVQAITSFFLLKNPTDIKNLPAIYSQMEKGDFKKMARLVMGLRAYCSSGDFYGMGLLMDAMTGVSKDQLMVIGAQENKSILGMTTNLPFPDLSEGLGLPVLGGKYLTDVTSRVPGLFISGTMDGRTFPEDARRIASKFKNVTFVQVENGGHDIFEQSPLIQELIVKYLKGEKIDGNLRLKPIEFARQ